MGRPGSVPRNGRQRPLFEGGAVLVHRKHPAKAAVKQLWRLGASCLPVPWQQFCEPALRRARDAGEHIGEPGLRIDGVELRHGDQRGRGGGALGAAF